MVGLCVGDRLQDSSIVIRDEDRLCYQVLSTSRGATGVRTISKTLLAEWVEAVKNDPHAQGGDLREKLCGKSEIDKFEYGYFSTLKKLADMILGNVPVIHATPDFSAEFCRWFADNRGAGKDTTAKKYLSYFKTLTDAYQEPTHSYWHGLYKVMYGHDAEKEVSAIGDIAEFDRMYGQMLPVLEDKAVVDGMDTTGCQKAIDWFWLPEVKPHTCVTSALKAYREFLKWREEQNTGGVEIVPTGDMLSFLVAQFKACRLEDAWVKLLKRDGYEGLHARYEGMNPDTLRKMSAAEFDKWIDDELWAARTFFCGQNIKKLSDADKTAFCGFIAATKQNFRLLSNYLGKDAELPNGVGPVVLTELLMKFHPLDYCNYNVLMLQGLKVLGLVESEKMPSALSVAEYQKLMGFAADILERLIEAKVPRMFDEDEKIKPDFITVNEFLWWCKVHQQDILNAVKEKQMAKIQKKPTTGKTTTGTATINALLENKEDSLMTRLVAALLTKPLVILAGASGTGKSRMVRHLAYKTCLDADLKPEGGSAPGNFKMIQVKPNWHDSADLLGYRSVVSETSRYVTTEFVKFVLKAHAYPNTPFFVCLDEMNLAPVEHYFAEFLSACESIRKDENGKWTSDPIVSATDFAGSIANLEGEVAFESDDAALDAQLKAVKAIIEKDGLLIPRNLFVVGTVNMDDTTGGFSRKVLDRAMTIEMNEVHFKDLQAEDKGLSMDAANLFTEAEIRKFIERPDFDGQTMLDDGFRDQMETLRGKLEKTPFALAYRFARETTLYRKALTDILDAAAVVKKGDGSSKTDGNGNDIDAKLACGEIALDHMVLMKLLPRLNGTVSQRETVLKDIDAFAGALIKDKKFSKDVLKDMVERAKDNGGYLSFWP